MPKIIDGLEQTILEEARRQVMQNGYSHMTVRSVAQACGIAVGTIYNYYPSKERLTAAFMLSEWLVLLEKMRVTCRKTPTPSAVMRCIYDGITAYAAPYRTVLFSDSAAEKSYAAVFGHWHTRLRTQIAALLEEICATATHPTAFLPEFLAESLLTWTLEQKDFAAIEGILLQFFK